MARRRITEQHLKKYILYFSQRRRLITPKDKTARENVAQAVISHAMAVDLRDCKLALRQANYTIESILSVDPVDPYYKAKVEELARHAFDDIDMTLLD